MKIKEIELRSGMDRANIRYYEKEGLLQPERTENGYREYSEKDLQQLLKVRLLRSLHFSLEDIKSLIQKKTTLSFLLKNQIRYLESETEDVLYAKSLCESIVSEGATFETLDAEKHLVSIEEATSESSSEYFNVDFEIPHVFEPIRRFAARTLDMALYGTLIVFLNYFIRGEYSPTDSLSYTFQNILTILVMIMILEPIQLKLFKRTFGKWIMGLYIENLNGSALSYEDSFRRTLHVLVRGMGLFIPLADLISLGSSFDKLRKGEILSWDRGLAYRMKDRKIYRYIIAFVLFFFISISVIIIPFLQNIPPNTGALTVEEFSENFRYYQKLHDMDFGNYVMNNFGKWEEKEADDRLEYLPDAVKYPHFRFRMNDHIVKEVNFSVTYEDNPFWVENYRDMMILASLSFTNADESMNIIERALLSGEIIMRFYAENFKSHTFATKNVEISNMVEYDGYEKSIEILEPINRERENYYHHEFFVRRTAP
ncbi:MerR family transcriptional regulator [Proteiniclasticum ruminis]|uniref:DNA-binding transcriptional regulator, MerR family n=1 Tax=Proteiniclasticum ruminis TaxID=398199 RepID=A0A1G8HFA5_9CLOT|nr:MerR family transcriptional regulator [Proteiniclasticum ruminis]SDI05255.1 DNA-binding transcriptional regulator, MerR family [Proteiniclasticum ruminis]